ncbi:MAG: glycosyltransferase family 2 protein [Treponemataceae bacterium]|nr:glycosyltransferase family 2 protein [Treponemataceae bacterium]
MISVCMATYNGARFIREQIDSILPQLDAEDELIISDDGSTDGTLGILAEYATADARVKVLHHEKNPAYAKIKHSRNFYYVTDNFENALRHAKGDYIFLADQDDVWLSEKKRKMVAALQENSSDCVMCNFALIDENKNIIAEKFYEASPITKKRVRNIIKSKYIGCCMAFSKELLYYVLPFPDELIAHDYWIGCLAENFVFIDEPLHLYRRYEDNVSTSSGKSHNSLATKILFRLRFAKLLYKRLFGK